jgi:hypothetical protein
MLITCNLLTKSNMVDYKCICGVYILIHKCPSYNYNTIPWFSNMTFYLVIPHIFTGQLYYSCKLIIKL